MRKAKTEIKIEPYPKGGWYVVERVGGKVWWQSSNYQSIELAEVRMKERKELKANTAKSLDNKLTKRLKPRNKLATKPTVKKREYNARQRYLTRFVNITSNAINSLKTKDRMHLNYLTLESYLVCKQPLLSELLIMAI